MAGTAHLVRRFAGSLWPAGPRAADEAWAAAQLLPEELALWRRMPRADRRHAVAVARRVAAALGERAERPVLAAALLHDVGKIDAALGTYGRVVATLSAKVAGREFAEAWSETAGFTRRVGLYLRHAEIGADRLALAGSDELTVAWAREHHLPADEWSVPRDIGDALKAADDD
ncbi:MAG: HD domain-containing protein [Actinobacteria bacterium]|nr:HD domain-containing protein [Actinomycetota bacterium]